MQKRIQDYNRNSWDLHFWQSRSVFWKYSTSHSTSYIPVGSRACFLSWGANSKRCVFYARENKILNIFYCSVISLFHVCNIHVVYLNNLSSSKYENEFKWSVTSTSPTLNQRFPNFFSAWNLKEKSGISPGPKVKKKKYIMNEHEHLHA